MVVRMGLCMYRSQYCQPQKFKNRESRPHKNHEIFFFKNNLMILDQRLFCGVILVCHFELSLPTFSACDS